MAIERRMRGWWPVPVGAVVLAATAAVAVPALAGGAGREQARTPTLASLAKQVSTLRAQDAALRKRITALAKKTAVIGVRGARGAQGAQGPSGAQGPAGPQGTPGGVDAYTRAESDARFGRGTTTDALVRVEVPPSATATLVDLGSLGRLQGTCGGLSTPPGTVLQPPASQTGAIDVVADVTGDPSLVLKVIDPATPTSVDLPGTGQAYHALIHVAQDAGPAARIAALDVTGFKIAAGAFPCRFTVRLTTAGLG